ncbi:MAG: putative transport system permease protein [Nocardioidaceae bacterium]|jgi:putative ABC transport system permease protein|nr:putative transport system permease protein [Nocardioidaceae bacterium]
MLHVTVRGLQGHVVRLLLTALAVMLGVSFVTGTFVLRDSIDNTLGGLVAQSAKGLDVSVRGAGTDAVSPVSVDGSTVTPGVPLALVETVAAVPGVARVMPNLQGTAILAGSDGIAVRNGGAPSLGFAFAEDDPSFTLVSGRGPTGPGEVAVETSTLDRAHLQVGDRTRAVIGNRARHVTITGEVHFGSLFGATAVLVDGATARRVYAPDGTVSSLSVTAAPGVSQAELRAAVAQALPPNLEAVTGATVQSETETSVQKGLAFFTTFLLVFAGVALFVGSFIIVNTFSMLIGQRARELALLRAIGATRTQVMRAVLGEAVVIGLVGSVLGIGLGLLIAAGAQAAIGRFLSTDIGAGLPVSATTVLLSVLVGVVVTVVSAVLPARRASRVAPVAAMRGDVGSVADGLGKRGLIGLCLLASGALVLGVAVSRAQVSWPVAALGAVATVLGMLVGAPLATRPVVQVIAWPFVAVLGAVGRLARENALRVPRRTATTASALMIGLALIAGISVLAGSVKASVSSGVAEELTSDFVLNSGNVAPVPAPLADAARALPAVRSVAAVSFVDLRIGSFHATASATTAADVADNFLVTMKEGQLSTLGRRVVLVDETTAGARGWHVGDTLSARVGTLSGEPLVVGGIYRDSHAFGSHVIVDRSLYTAALPANQRADARLFLRAVPGADLPALRAELTHLVRPYLIVSVQDGPEFADAQGASIDTLINLLYVLLLFSVIVAVLGIINTLALSVFERTREIGLLRAVGLRRRQLSSMITIESVATAGFGAVLGTALGIGLGVALQRGLDSQGLTTLAIPWTLILVMLLASGVVGVLAAALPALRAMRLNILQAIASS